MADVGGAEHEDPDLDALLGAVVIAGGELDCTHPDYIWAFCPCQDATHTILVQRRISGRQYKDRKIMQFVDHPCMGMDIKKGGEL